MMNTIVFISSNLFNFVLYIGGGNLTSRLGFHSNVPSDNSSEFYWNKECDRKVIDSNNISSNSFTPPRMKLSSLLSPIITSGSYHTEVNQQII